MAPCFHDITSGSGLIGSLFLAGLAGGFTHCTAMCSPFVMAQVSPTTPNTPFLHKLKGATLIPYHLGRMTTYVALALLFGAFLNAIIIPSPLRTILNSIILLTAALIFLTNVIPALGSAIPFLNKIRLPLPANLLQKMSAPFIRPTTIMKQFILGLLLGFMPCGMVMAALMAAGSLPTPLQSALAMAAFAIGTIPALILSSVGGHALVTRFPQSFSIFRLSMVVLSSGVLLLTMSKIILSS
jgi:sulfite exporter TauE/SafE